MAALSAPDVLALSRTIDEAWLHVVDGAQFVQTEDFLAGLRPAHLTSPSSARTQVWIRSTRPLSELRVEIDQAVRCWGQERAQWRIPGEHNRDADDWLRFVGASFLLSERVLARSLAGLDADSWLSGAPATGVSTAVVRDRESFDELVEIESAGWERPRPSSDLLAAEWANLQSDARRGTEFALLGHVNGAVGSVARLAMFEHVARLFGSVTLPEFRRRGLYGALLRARCKLGRDLGATIALTKGRSDTSAPVLKHAGFDEFGTEHSWLVPCGTD